MERKETVKKSKWRKGKEVEWREEEDDLKECEGKGRK